MGDFLSYVPSEAIKDSSIELYHIDIDALDSSSATEALFGSDPIDIVNDEVTYRLEDDYFFEDFNPRTVSSLAVLYSSELDDDICYVYAKYDRERFIEKLEDEEFVREDYENIEFYTDGYEAVIPLKNGFLLCDDDDIMVLLETKTGKKESILDSGMEEKDFSLKYSDSHLGFMIAGGYYDNLVSGGVWQTGKKLKMRMLAGYPDKDQADQFAKSFEELMKGQKEGGGLGSFDISRVNDRTLQITITGIVDQEVMEMFF